MEKRSVYSMLAEQVIFSGTKSQCEDFIENNYSEDNPLYMTGYAEVL